MIDETAPVTTTAFSTLRLFAQNVAYRWQERVRPDDHWLTTAEARKRLLGDAKKMDDASVPAVTRLLHTRRSEA